MIAGFRKKRGNIRRKVEVSDEEDDSGNDSSPAPAVVKPSIIKQPVKPPIIKQPAQPKLLTAVKKERKPKPSATLSFGDEEEPAEEFKIKRSKASIKLNAMIKEEKKEKFKKKKGGDANSNSNSAAPSISAFANMAVKEEVKKEETTASGNGLQIGLQIHTFEDEEDWMTDETAPAIGHGFNMGMGMSGGAIPDAATIYQMKKRREQARVQGVTPDYIPVKEVVKKYEGRFGDSSSRLVREDMDGDSSGDERVAMKGDARKSHPAAERRKQVALALEEQVDDMAEDGKKDEEDELQQWEDEQIKKGTKTHANLDTHSSRASVSPLPPPPQLPFLPSFSSVVAAFTAPPVCLSFSIPAAEQAVSVEMIMHRISEQLSTKTELHRMHQLEREKVKFDLDSSKKNIIDLEGKSEDSSDRFTFFQDTRGYVKDLSECLSEKVKKLDELETSIHDLAKKRAAKLITRRQNDLKDELEQTSGKESQESSRVNNIKQRRVAEREARRARRKEKWKGKEYEERRDGMSTDDEEQDADVLRFRADNDKISKEVASLFEDVIEDFKDLPAIMARFEQWKLAFSDSYEQAYISLTLPKLFTPYIKFQTLHWNPLKVVCADFEVQEWYTTLAMYGHATGLDDDSDADIKLLPRIIEKVLIPKITALVEDIWDPMSTQQNKRLVELFRRLISDYPTLNKDSKTAKKLVESIITRLKKSVESDLFIPLFQKSQLESRNSLALPFLRRQFWSAFKLFENVMQWNWLLSRQKLQELAIDGIVNRYMTIALHQLPSATDSVDACKQVVGLIPKSWLESSTEEKVFGLESFARCLDMLAAKVLKSAMGTVGEADKKRTKLTITRIISLLMRLQEFEMARNIARTYKGENDKPDDTQSDIAEPVEVIT